MKVREDTRNLVNTKNVKFRTTASVLYLLTALDTKTGLGNSTSIVVRQWGHYQASFASVSLQLSNLNDIALPSHQSVILKNTAQLLLKSNRLTRSIGRVTALEGLNFLIANRAPRRCSLSYRDSGIPWIKSKPRTKFKFKEIRRTTMW
jgi:hypothetical protein